VFAAVECDDSPLNRAFEAPFNNQTFDSSLSLLFLLSAGMAVLVSVIDGL
jgi:hypothetical protein